MSEVKVITVRTPQLEIAYEEEGAPEGFPVILMHGFPDDVRVWDGTASILSSAGYRVLMPYLRGYGPTRFIDPDTPRVGQQAALGLDLLQFMDALRLERASIAGYDWGCRACCVAAILDPKRIRALVAIGGYDVHDLLSPPKPAPPALEADAGINGTLIRSVGKRDWKLIEERSVESCGNAGRQAGILTNLPSSERPIHSRIRILYKW